MMLPAVIVLILGLFCFSLAILSFIQAKQNEPYMDEIFHVPQAQQYCATNFTNWDPMITTLPGLYLSSLVLLFPLALIQGKGDLYSVCSTFNLRAGNIVYCCGNFILLFLLSRLLYLKTQSRRGPTCHLLLNAITMCTFPLLYFFTWLYYTDPGAVFFTLLMYFLCLQGNHKLASISGAVSIVFRQTNVIWVLFCLALTAGDVLDVRLKKEKKRRQLKAMVTDLEELRLIFHIVFSDFYNFFCFVKEVLIKCFSYLCILLCFVVFVYVNKGIVVGDRSNHQASFNFPQVFYFLAVSSAFAFIHILHPLKILACVKTVFKNPVKSILFAVIAFFLIKHYTYEHKYTLSDNRHYTFYVWSKIFKRFEYARYAAIPIYLFSLISFYHLTSHKGLVWRWAVAICTVLCLVPQGLLEFRYYIIPFYILRLNMPLPSVKAMLVELFVYAAINAFTVYMFMQKPFYWPHDPSPQRFMW